MASIFRLQPERTYRHESDVEGSVLPPVLCLLVRGDRDDTNQWQAQERPHVTNSVKQNRFFCARECRTEFDFIELSIDLLTTEALTYRAAPMSGHHRRAHTARV